MKKRNFHEFLRDLDSTNLINGPEEIIHLTDEPKMPCFSCFPSEKAKKKYYTTNQFGSGFDAKEIVAKVKSAGEFLERLCLFNPNEGDFFVSRYIDNKNKLVNPELFCCYSKEQFKDKKEFLEKIKKEKYCWWPVKNISNGEKTFIPAHLVFLSSKFRNELPIRREMISTGAALGPAENNHAFKTGFLESIERDASTSAYIKKKQLPRITDLPEEITKIIKYLERYQLEPYIFDMTNDLEIPSCLVVTLDRTKIGPAVCVGASSNFDFKEAIKGALLESFQWRGVSRLIEKFHLDSLPKEDEVDSMTKRFFYWYSTDKIKYLDFWLKSSNKISYKKLIKKNTTLKQAINKIKKRGYNIFSADMTLPELKKAGFEGKKVIIPEIHPLYLDEKARALYSQHFGELKYDKKLKPHPIS